MMKKNQNRVGLLEADSSNFPLYNSSHDNPPGDAYSSEGLDPMRLYIREIGRVPLLTREGEILLAKRIENGSRRTQRAIMRSPIAIAELLRIGDELSAGVLKIRDVVTFSDQSEPGEPEERTEEYLRLTLEGIGRVRKLYSRVLKEWQKLQAEEAFRRGRRLKGLLR
ncbi:MAG: hypothetical protein L0220_19220, partial [Acidobacteria bacterium]|nr:hypothetical protein [Acidobacteriota bacterium]